MVHPELFDDVRMPVLRATDRLRVLAPIIDEALRHRYGPNWGERLRRQDRRAGRSTSGLYDPRYLLRLIAHEPALADVFDADAQRKARSRLMAGVFADGLLKAAGLEVEGAQRLAHTQAPSARSATTTTLVEHDLDATPCGYPDLS